MMRSFCSASVSEIPGGSASGVACRIASGTVCETNSPTSDTPMIESMSLTSSGDGPMCRREKSFGSKSPAVVANNIFYPFRVVPFGWLLFNVSRDSLLVSLLIEQTIEFGRIGDFDLKEPALAHRISVHKRWFIHDSLIDFGDFAAHWRIDVGGGLDGLDNRRRRPLFGSRSQRRQFDEHKIAELLLCMRRDSNGGDIALYTKPLVVFREFQHRACSPLFSCVCSDAGRTADRRLATQRACRGRRRKCAYPLLQNFDRCNPLRSVPARSGQSRLR